MKTFASFLLATTLLAADKAPVISPEIEGEYYRADGKVAHMRAEWEAANADVQAAVLAIQKACGDKYTVLMDGKHLVCAPKPEPPKATPTK